MNYAATLTPPVAVLVLGPAGVTAGYLLARAGVETLVLEAEDQVGGLAKTVVRDGYRFDLGGHRFFTKSAGGRAALARGDGRGAARPPAAVAHLLERPLPRLPAAARNVVGSWARSSCALRALVRRGRAAAAGRGADVRAVGDEPLRAAALRAVLPFVHGEGLGRADERDPGGVGGTADPRPLLRQRRPRRAARQQAATGSRA